MMELFFQSGHARAIGVSNCDVNELRCGVANNKLHFLHTWGSDTRGKGAAQGSNTGPRV